MFPETPQTLLKKIAELAAGDDRAEWLAFVELYEPPVRNFVRAVNRGLSPSDVDDAVQEVFVKLVDVLRKERVDREKGKFRDYLAVLTRRLLIDRYRAELVRPSAGTVPFVGGTVPESQGTVPLAVGVLALDPGMLADLRWRMAAHAAAVEHVLTKTAISEQSAQIYRAVEGLSPDFRGLSPKEIAARFGVSVDVVKQVRSRLNRAIAAVERRMTEI